MHQRLLHSARRALMVPASAMVLLLAGCGENNDGPTGPDGTPETTTMSGVMVNAVENGRLAVSIANASLAAAPGTYAVHRVNVDATGTYRRVGGSTVTLTGTYDVDTDSLVLTGGGYTLLAQVETDGAPASMVGEYDGPNGAGFFGAVETDAGAAVSVHCGTYQSTTTSEDGNLSLVITDDNLAGAVFSAQTSASFAFEGLLSGGGATRTFTAGGTDGADSISVIGTYDAISGASIGTWTMFDPVAAPSDSGTWSSMPCP